MGERCRSTGKRVLTSCIADARFKVAAGQEIVEEQQRGISALRLKGLPTDNAQALLSAIMQTLRLYREALARMEASQGAWSKAPASKF